MVLKVQNVGEMLWIHCQYVGIYKANLYKSSGLGYGLGLVPNYYLVIAIISTF